MSANNGGSAFPTAVLSDDQGRITHGSSGLTMRDYFAAKAMQGFAADTEAAWTGGVTGMASCAYEWADAMLKARES